MNNNRIISLSDMFFLLALYIMIFVTIFNGNEYVAGLAFVLIPSLLLLIAALPMKKKLFNINSLLALLLIFSATISTYTSFLDLKTTTFLNLVFCIASYIIVSNVVLTSVLFKNILNFYMLFCLVVCLVLLFNHIFHFNVQVFSDNNVRVTISLFGVAKDVNYLSSFVVASFPYFLYRGCFSTGTKDLIKAGLIFFAIFVAGSRACFLAMSACAIIILVKLLRSNEGKVNKKMIFFSLLVGGIVLSYFVFNSVIFKRTTDIDSYQDNSRLIIWEAALEAFYRNVLWGSGVESGSYFSLLVTNWKTHNCFIDILTGQGLIGTAIVSLMFCYFMNVHKNNRMVMTFCLISFFVPLFFVNGYECATFWTPMILCKYIHDKCKGEKDVFLYH